jgi:methylamine dehydrogenase heavy chain
LGNRWIKATASRRRTRISLAMTLAAWPLAGALAQPVPIPPVLPVEDSDTAVLPPAGPHRLITLPSIIGGSGTVVDGDDPRLKVVGTVPMPGNAALALSRDASRIYVTETYWSHGNRGDRADLLSVYDGRTLELLKEIPLPGRLLVTAKLGQMGLSDDDALAYVYALVPGSQAHVVDLASGKVLTSVDLSGCALVYPYGPRSFATLCGDGTVGTATLSASGKAEVAFSPKFFDPDHDPIFENSLVDRTTGEAWLLSFTGKIYPARLGDKPAVGKPWSINAAAGLPEAGDGVQELAWRPGGGQLMALHRASRRLYVLMHAGNYWTQKSAGTEVWVLDSVRHILIRRIPLAKPAKSIQVTQDAKPMLFAFGGEENPASLTTYDAETGRKLSERRLQVPLGLVAGL